MANLLIKAMFFLNNKCAIYAPWKICDGAEGHSKQKKCYRLSDLEKEKAKPVYLNCELHADVCKATQFDH